MGKPVIETKTKTCLRCRRPFESPINAHYFVCPKCKSRSDYGVVAPMRKG